MPTRVIIIHQRYRRRDVRADRQFVMAIPRYDATIRAVKLGLIASNINKRRALAAQTARSRCNFQYARRTVIRRQVVSRLTSTWVGVSKLEYLNITVINATWQESTDAFSVLHARISLTEAGRRHRPISGWF